MNEWRDKNEGPRVLRFEQLRLPQAVQVAVLPAVTVLEVTQKVASGTSPGFRNRRYAWPSAMSSIHQM